MAEYHGVIFDVDGTLVQSNDAHAHAWADALHEHGYDVSFEQVRKLIGMGSDTLLPKTIQVEKESQQGQALTQRRGQIFQEQYLPTLAPLPGARELVQHLRDDGLQLIVASSAASDELRALLEIAQVADLLPERVSADDVKHSKPEPDIVVVALQRLGLSPEKALMIADTPFDIQAATKAGVGVIALRCGGWQDRELSGALAIYNDPADLLAQRATSPLGAKPAAPAPGFARASEQQRAEDDASDARALRDQPA